MKSKKIAIALTLTLILGVGCTIFAAETTTNTKNNTATHQALGMNRMAGIRGYDSITYILKNKLGLTDKEITDELSSGKTVYDLALEKGITQEQGDTLKETLNTNQASCTGNFGGGNLNLNETDNSHGNGGGMMGSG